VYAKSWCRYKHLRGSSAAYATWREQITACIIARPLDPGHFTESHVDSIIWFARGLSAVKERIEVILCAQHADEVWELIRHLKILVKDSAKKLQTSNEHQRAEHEGHRDIVEPPGKSYLSLFCYSGTNRCCQWLILIGTPHIHREQCEFILLVQEGRWPLRIRSYSIPSV